MEKSYIDLIQTNKTNKIDGLHPKTKFLVLILYCVCCFILGTFKLTKYELPLYQLLWLGVLLGLFAASGCFMKCIKGCKLVGGIAAIILVAQTLIVPGGDTIFKLGFLTIEEGGLQKGFSLSIMVLDIAGIFVWFFQTTEHKEIAQALEDSGVNYKVSYVFISSLKMVDVMGKNSKTIMNAQKARGVETEGNMIVRAKAFVPSLIPLILSAITGAEERVLTLEARGFDAQGEKTRLFKLKKSGWEKQATVISVAVTAVILVWRIVAWII